MSSDGDDKDKNRGRGGGKDGGGEPPEKVKVEPVPKRPDLFEFLEKLFHDETSFPDLIDVRVVYGARFERLGAKVTHKSFQELKRGKPSREKLVTLSNEIVHRCQVDCDVQRKGVVYAVNVIQHKSDPDSYERFLIRCQPGKTYQDGKGFGFEAHFREGEDGEDGLPLAEKYSVQLMSFHKDMSNLWGSSFEGLLDRDHRLIVTLYQRISDLEARNASLNEQLERALSLQIEREERREWAKVRQDAVKKAVELGFNLAPPILGQLLGKDLAPNSPSTPSPDALVLRNFLKTVEDGGSFTKEQEAAVFGVWVDGPNGEPSAEMVRPGALSAEQGKLIYDVAYGRSPDGRLDELILPGPLCVNQAQFLALATQCHLAPEQLMPLQVMFEGRVNRIKAQVEAEQQQASKKDKEEKDK